MGSVTASQGNESLKCACGNEIKNVQAYLQDCAKWQCRKCFKKGLPVKQQEELGGRINYCKDCGIELNESNAYGMNNRRAYLCKGCENKRRREKVA